MNIQTIGFIVALIVAIAIFDVRQYVEKGSNATISHVLYAAAQRWPIIPFLIGIVAGHLFWLNA